MPFALTASADPLAGVVFEPFVMPETCRLAADWQAQLFAGHEPGEWVPLELAPNDEQLAALGLPPARILTTMRFPEPTMLTPLGDRIPVPLAAISPSAGPTPTSYAGTGCFGIRPGALLLTVTDSEIGICSMAHVYGSPGAYQVSTAGHCAEKVGEVKTVIAAVGNHAGVLSPVLLDFGKTAKTSGDGGVGRDWALLSVDSAYQSLVTPTMCVWAGPRGAYTQTGLVADANVVQGNRIGLFLSPVNADPTLVQGIVHYGHGLGLGTGGTPRAGAAFLWDSRSVRFEGTITPGDSGSGANTADGRAAAIVTHLLVPAVAGNGVAVAAGTRVSQVPATLANGQLLPYPVPLPGAP